MINLLPKTEINRIRRSRYQRAVYAVTTWLVVVYIITIAGFAGWWFFLAKTQVQVSGEVTNLTVQLNQLATREVLVRQYRERLKIVDTALKKHLTLSQQLAQASPSGSMSTLAWDFDGKGQTFRLSGTDTLQLQNFIDTLHASVKNLSRTDKPIWEVTIATFNK